MAAKKRKKTKRSLAKSGAHAAAGLNLDELRSLIALCKESGVADLRIKGDTLEVSISFAQQRISEYISFEARPTSHPMLAHDEARHPTPHTIAAEAARHTEAASSPAGAPSGAEPPKEAVDETRFVTVASPMVGTFYRAPAPDADPYVEVGAAVEESSVLCIIEAMKLMNEIKAETHGVIAEILVENGQPVEYGQPLFRIAPA